MTKRSQRSKHQLTLARYLYQPQKGLFSEEYRCNRIHGTMAHNTWQALAKGNVAGGAGIIRMFADNRSA